VIKARPSNESKEGPNGPSSFHAPLLAAALTLVLPQPCHADQASTIFGLTCNQLIIKHKYKEAMAMANQELRVHPNQASAFVIRGWIYSLYDEPEKALKEWDQALKIDPAGSFELFSNRYRTYLDQGKFDLAIQDITKALSLRPDEWVLYKERGQVHSVLKQYDLAIKDITKAISLNSREPLCYQRRADCYRAAGQYGKAAADYTTAIKLCPNQLLFYSLRADCYDKIGKHSDAVADRKKVESSMRETGF
jgi:tetratricopeptide (TPR) repeat protein